MLLNTLKDLLFNNDRLMIIFDYNSQIIPLVVLEIKEIIEKQIANNKKKIYRNYIPH